jgi:hypothetical protein
MAVTGLSVADIFHRQLGFGSRAEARHACPYCPRPEVTFWAIDSHDPTLTEEILADFDARHRHADVLAKAKEQSIGVVLANQIAGVVTDD